MNVFIVAAYAQFILIRPNLPPKANRMSDIATIYRVDTCLLPSRISFLRGPLLLTTIKIYFRG